MKIYSKQIISPSKQIQELYEEFESLKSKIYQSDSLEKSYGKDSSDRKKDGVIHNHSEIKQRHREFVQNMKLINDNSAQYRFSTRMPSYSISLQKKQRSINQSEMLKKSEGNARKSILSEFEKSQELFKVLLKSQSYEKSLEKKKSQQDSEKQTIRIAMEGLMKNFQYKFYEMYQAIGKLFRRLHYISIVLRQYAQVKQIRDQSRCEIKFQQKSAILKVQQIQKTYNQEIDDLVRYYEQIFGDMKKKHKEELARSQRQYESDCVKRIQVESSKYRFLFEQSQQLAQTRQELVLSLTQENSQLKEKLKNVTAQKHKKQEHQIKQVNLEEVDYSQLQSIADDLQQWDISHLSIRGSGGNPGSAQKECQDFIIQGFNSPVKKD